MQLVHVSAEGSVELQLNVEHLSSADDQLVSMVQIRMVLPSVLAHLGAQQVHRTHRQPRFCEEVVQ